MGQEEVWYEKNSAFGKAFRTFYEAHMKPTVLDEKTKCLLKVALACVLRCRHCTEGNIENALKAGASKDEVREALLMAALEGAGTQLAWNKDFFAKTLG